MHRTTGGNRIYSADITKEQFADAVVRGLQELQEWAEATNKIYDIGKVTVESSYTLSGKISISVEMDLESVRGKK